MKLILFFFCYSAAVQKKSGLLSSPPFGEFFLNAAVLRGRKVKREEYGGSDEATRGLGALRRMKEDALMQRVLFREASQRDGDSGTAKFGSSRVAIGA